MLPRQRECEVSPPVAHSLGLTTTPAGQIALHIKSVRVAGGFPQFTGRCPTSLSRANGMGGPLRGGRNRLAVSPRPLDCNVQPLSSSIHGTDRPFQLRRYLLHAPSFRDHRAQLMVVLRRPFFSALGIGWSAFSFSRVRLYYFVLTATMANPMATGITDAAQAVAIVI